MIPARADDAAQLPGPTDETAAEKAGRDAGREQVSSSQLSASAQAASTNTETYRVFATQYHPNTRGSVEVAVPDRCAKFASLGWTSALSSANCPSGYKLDMDWRVLVRRDSGERLRIRVKDVGPWNIDDNYWNRAGGPRPRRLFTDLPRGKPEAQAAYYDGYNTVSNCKKLDGSLSGRAGPADQFGRCVLNPAGIDLSVAAAAKLGLGNLQNEWVTVKFLWEKTSTPRQPHILWRDTVKGKASLWRMSGTEKRRAVRIQLPKGARFPRAQWSVVATADFNRDRAPDVLWWNRDTNKLVVWFMKGTKRIGRAVVDPNGATPGAAWRPVATADLDRDGRVDLLWHNASSGHVSVWYMGRTKRKSSSDLALATGSSWPSPDWSPFAAPDLDGDKIPDVLWHNASTGRVQVWYLSGAAGNRLSSSKVLTLPSGASWPSPTTWTPVGAGDFDRDRKVDVLWHNTSNGRLSVWLMTGGDGSAMSSSTSVSAASFPPPTKVPIVWR